MRVDQVEIYSDQTNMSVLRHPNRRYPGVLIQGDTLSSIVHELDIARARHDDEGREALNLAAERLREMLDHYRAVLSAHGIAM